MVRYGPVLRTPSSRRFLVKRLLMALVALLVIYPSSAMAQDKPQPAPKSETTVTVAATGNASPTVTVNSPSQQAAPAGNASAPAPTTPATPDKPSGEPAKPAVEAPKSSPLGKAFVTRSATDYKSAEEYAKILLSCKDKKNSKLQMSCDEAVKTFNENDAFDEIADVKDIDELATFIRNSTEMKICPQRKTLIAYVLDGKVKYFERDLREGEPCLFSASHNVYIASGVCGQWIGTKFGGIFTNDNADDSKKNAGSLGLTPAELRRIIEEELRRNGDYRESGGAKEKKVDSHWYTPTPVKVGIAAGVGLAVVCAIVPGHCVMKQT